MAQSRTLQEPSIWRLWRSDQRNRRKKQKSKRLRRPGVKPPEGRELKVLGLLRNHRRENGSHKEVICGLVRAALVGLVRSQPGGGLQVSGGEDIGQRCRAAFGGTGSEEERQWWVIF